MRVFKKMFGWLPIAGWRGYKGCGILLLIVVFGVFVNAIGVYDTVSFITSSLNVRYSFSSNITLDSVTRDSDSSMSNPHWTFGNLSISARCVVPAGSESNVTINWWNSTSVNITVSSPSCSTFALECGQLLSSTVYNLSLSGIVLNRSISDSSGYIDLSGSYSAGNFMLEYGGFTSCSITSYGLWNGTEYLFAENQSIEYYCFPYHQNCVPYHETVTRPLINITGASSGASFKMSLNETDSRINFKVYDSWNSTLANSYNLSTTSLLMHGTAPASGVKEYWMWIDMRYPFRTLEPTLYVEVCR